MLETIAFNRGELRNASQKLYKFCLERGMPVPEYSIRNVKTNQGFMYAAQCAALDHVGVGTLSPHRLLSSSYYVTEYNSVCV